MIRFGMEADPVTGKNDVNIRGSITALVTPFRNGQVDGDALDRLVDRQIAAGTDWLAACGTTGEAPTLTEEEQETILTRVLARSNGRCPVMAGTGTYDTASTVRRTRRAAELGAQAALIVTPYYNRPTQAGMFQHFAAIAKETTIPIVLYNVPARTGVHLANDTVVKLRKEFPSIVALKDASNSTEHVTDLLARCDIDVLCGDDALTLAMMAQGAVGVISVLSNLLPQLMKSLVSAAASGQFDAARAHHRRVSDLAHGLARCGPNPLPIKTAMAMCKLIQEEFRLPLCTLDAEQRTAIQQLLRRHEVGGLQA
ncbi:MAG: 4-hydroxy-tetrahydrodipicolinate synthase [Planctomycetes bacterium]|nr:4-hydroxy-tetrahydrodipicolinate synthase [Planctomycetota bacterium]